MSNLSRAYRPKLFGDISGQQKVIETLRREIEQDKLGHAYLFSGPRGVGKTTAARIFAKAVNCEDPQKGEPCLKCTACLRIAQNQAIDLIEMDAASHRGVSEIQEAVIDHIKYVPAALKYKVYILDEAHMLTDHAWNALLKTVEEPPEYAIFIFATTERHKVPATIVSRCQRFEFGRIEPKEVVDRLKELAKSEKVEVADEVLFTIAAKTEGCLRDAENLLGQLMSLGEKKITGEIASIIIPPSQKPIAAELLKLAIAGKTGELLELIGTLEQEGVSFIPLFDDLITSLRDILLAKHIPHHLEMLNQAGESEKMLAGLTNHAEDALIVQASHILIERRREAKHGIDPRFALELGLVAISTQSSQPVPNPVPDQQETHTSPSSVKTETRSSIPPPPVEPSTRHSQLDRESTKPAVNNKPDPINDDDSSFNQQKQNDSPTNLKTADQSNNQLQIQDVQRIWYKFLQEFEDSKSLLFILKPCRVIGMEGDCVLLELEFAYHKKNIENARNKQLIENALRKHLGTNNTTIKGIIAEQNPDQFVKKTKDTANSIIDAFGGELIS
jgi:DNA polymerase-3 subunit gamma/tau